MNIAELLEKYAKVGDVFYTTICGNVPLLGIGGNNENIQISEDGWWDLNSNGCLTDDIDAECVIFPSKTQRNWEQWAKEKGAEKEEFEVDDYVKIDYNNEEFLAKIIRINKTSILFNLFVKDWTNEVNLLKKSTKCTKLNKYSADLLKPGQLVLIRDIDNAVWCLSIFSDKNKSWKFPYRCINYATYAQCIPYNFETKQLLGTSDKPNDFYIF